MKKLIVVVIAAFVLFYLLTAPVGAANVVFDAWDATMWVFSQIGVFIDSVVNRW